MQSQGSAAAAAIRIVLVRRLPPNPEGLRVVQNDVSAIPNDTAQILRQRRGATALGTKSICEDDRPQAARPVSFYHVLRGNRIIMGKLSQQCPTRCSPFRTPAGHRVCTYVDIESHPFAAKHLN